MFEDRLTWDLPPELRAVVECMLEVQIRPAIESLERASQVTEEVLFPECRVFVVAPSTSAELERSSTIVVDFRDLLP